MIIQQYIFKCDVCRHGGIEIATNTYVSLYPTWEPARPTLPDGWQPLLDGRIVCPRHVVAVTVDGAPVP